MPPPRAHPVPVGDSANAAELDPELEDSFQLIVATMEHELAGVSGKSIAITGVGADETTTSTTLEIAHAASQQDRRVLLIDADVRTRDLTNRVGHPAAAIGQDGAGRGHRQRGHRPRQEPVGDLSGAALEYVDRLVPTNSGSVLPLTSTTADGGANGAVDVRHAVWSIGDLFDLVLVDAPALLGASNAIGVVGQADAVVLVVPHRTALGNLRNARDRLAFVKTPLLGYVYVRPRRLGRRSKRASPRGQRS